MSKLSLSSITRNYKDIKDEFLYAGSIVRSQSGSLSPVMIKSLTDLQCIFGDFEYKLMYENLIKDQIPLCLMPILTPLSKYNRCSLRLSNGDIPVSYPRLDRKYHPIESSIVLSKSFTSSDYIYDDSNGLWYLEIKHSLDFYPEVLFISNDSSVIDNTYHHVPVKFKLKYEPGIIKAYTQENNRIPCIASIEHIPSVDNKIVKNNFNESNSQILVIDSYSGELNVSIESINGSSILPEIVVTDKDGYEVITNNSIIHDDETGLDKLSINCELGHRIDIRIIPKELIILNASKVSEVDLIHNSNRYPNIQSKIEDTESIIQSKYTSKNLAVVTYKGLIGDLSRSVQYNILNTASDFDFTSIKIHQTSFNIILDFSDVKYEDLIFKSNGLDRQAPYILLDVVGNNVLITPNHNAVDVSINYFNDILIIGGSGELNVPSILDNLKSEFNSRYTGNCVDIEDQIIEFLNECIDDYPEPLKDQFGVQVNVEDWKKGLLDKVYEYDFWLETQDYVHKILSGILYRLDSDGNILLDGSDEYHYVTYKDIVDEEGSVLNFGLISSIRELNLGSKSRKLMFKYTSPIQDKNFYKLPGLKVYDSNIYTEDVLCQYSESTKLLEFYSKIKGPVGKNITIDITKHQFHELYDILISNGVIEEFYTVRLYDFDCPEDSIYVTDIDKLSRLVETRFYDYKFRDTWIDSRFFNDSRYLGEWSEKNIRPNSERYLTPGTYKLDRVIEEDLSYDNYLNSINIFGESEYYPDLFIVDSTPPNPSYIDDLLDILRVTSESTLASQAVINLNYYNLDPDWVGKYNDIPTYQLKSEDNRVLYCYGELQYESGKLPTLYVLVRNILKQSYLEIPEDRFIYDPFEIKIGNPILLYKELSEQYPRKCIKILDKVDNYITYEKVDVKLISRLDPVITYKKISDSHYHLYKDDVQLTQSDGSPVILITHDLNATTELITSTGYGLIKDNKIYLLNSLQDDITSAVDSYYFESIMKLMSDLRINYFNYNNLRYYYDSLNEPLGQSSIFLIRFVTSKISRELLKLRHDVVGLNIYEVFDLVSEVYSNCLSSLDLISEMSYELLPIESNKISVTFNVTIKKLINKTYKVSYILNV